MNQLYNSVQCMTLILTTDRKLIMAYDFNYRLYYYFVYFEEVNGVTICFREEVTGKFLQHFFIKRVFKPKKYIFLPL